MHGLPCYRHHSPEWWVFRGVFLGGRVVLFSFVFYQGWTYVGTSLSPKVYNLSQGCTITLSCPFYRFRQKYSEIYPSLQYITECFTKNPWALPIHLSCHSPPLATTDLYIGSIVLPFPECHLDGLRFSLTAFRLASFTQSHAFKVSVIGSHDWCCRRYLCTGYCVYGHVFSILLSTRLGVELLGCMVTLYLTAGGTAGLLPILQSHQHAMHEGSSFLIPSVFWVTQFYGHAHIKRGEERTG